MKKDNRTYEVTFCARVKTWSEEIFAAQKDAYFAKVEIEESKGIGKKRSDLRIYRRKTDRTPLVAGEVKMPGTVEGMDPYSGRLLQDAEWKASECNARFFFTWNVNKLVLFDRKLWDKPFIERRVQEFDLGLDLQSPDDLGRPEVESAIREFLGGFYAEVEAIAEDRRPDWGMPPDLLFIRAFESHIAWPVRLTAEFLTATAGSDKAFDAKLQEWMAKQQGWQVARNDARVWRELIDRAARTLCYVFANRLIFYESVRKKFSGLAELSIPKKARDAEALYKFFAATFQDAVDHSGDYETLFYPEPEGGDMAGRWIFGHETAADAWSAVLNNLRPLNFTQIKSDILGSIFQRLIAPEERHRFGQHYTNEELVDLINSFCIRRGKDTVLDPACGSGSFLVRAYNRKRYLDPRQRHDERLAQIFGADLSLFAAHLATLNLAAREIEDEANYPRVARRNFFEVRASQPFCHLPSRLGGGREPVLLPKLDAIVGNPPYVRQELIPRRKQKGLKPMQAKEDISDLVYTLWPGLRLTGRSDLHCYFWPVAAALLKEEGWFGFLVSSSWLDVDYGFRLQEWILQNFRIHAVFESTAEPWFEDARVKTSAILLQRCASGEERMAQLVKFVRLDVPLKTIFGRIEETDEDERQHAVDKFRDLILKTKEDKHTDRYRIIVKSQLDLWQEGLRAGRIFELQRQRNQGALVQNGEDDDAEEAANGDEHNGRVMEEAMGGGYGGGKWGKYLRAPDLYFEIMHDYGSRFVPLGEIADIRFGVKSGCDKFFMPRDVSSKLLAKYGAADWNDVPLHTPCKRREVESGKVRLVEDGMGVVHPIEAEYLQPEVHSLMNVQRPRVLRAEIERLILQVSQPLKQLRGTYVEKYLRYGEKTPFASTKSKAVPVPERSTCASRSIWYDLTNTRPGILFWPMAQQYRHVIPANPDKLICNHNLFDVDAVDLSEDAAAALPAILNSTLIANFKTFYGRYAGTEGNLKTEVVDVNLIEVPDPRHASASVRRKLAAAFARLCQRDTMPMVEEVFMNCRSPREAAKLAARPIEFPTELKMPDRRDLDLAVFELIGVSDPKRREELCDRLYTETARHFRAIRIVEIQKQEQRAGVASDRVRVEDWASDVWDALSPDEREPFVEWLASRAADGPLFDIPEGRPHLHDATDMFSANVVHFTPQTGQAKHATAIEYPTRPHAELASLLASHQIYGRLRLPRMEAEAASLLADYRARHDALAKRFAELAQTRTDDPDKGSEILGLLFHWLVAGRR